MLGLKKTIILNFILLLAVSVYTQELPPIDIFTSYDYNAENQNWDISQGVEKNIYIANNKGLLEYNGEVWHLYNTPNQTIMRSVTVVKDRVYTGCYMEFGYWSKLNTGVLEYTSLSNSTKIDLIEDEQIWNIIALENWVLFQSFNRIYIYNSFDESFKTINAKSSITKSYLLDNGSVFYQDLDYGIFEIKNGVSSLLAANEFLKKEIVINIFTTNEGYILLTQNNGFFHLNVKNQLIKPWNVSANKLVKNVTIYDAERLKNGDYVIGTISDGVFVFDNKGNLKYDINQYKGLNNNTVLNIFEDEDNNIWLGLDNGINCINSNSAIRIYNDDKGDLGTVYASVIHNGKLYLGTNQGLFFKTQNSQKAFQFIENTQGQVWDLKVINNSLFCGHNMGTFIVADTKAVKIASIQGTWSVKKIEGQPNMLLQGNYDGLHILEKKNGKWTYKNKIEGFNISSRFFELIGNKIFINHEYKGVFKVDVNKEFTKVLKTKCDSTLKGSNSGLINYQGNLLYAYKKGVYKYEMKSDRFLKDTLLSNMYSEENYVSGKLINDVKAEKLWGFTATDFVSVSPGKFSKNPIIEKVKLPKLIGKGMASYESLLNIDNQNYLFGTSSGYIIVDINNNTNSSPHQIKLDYVYSGKFNAINNLENINKEGFYKSKINSFEFKFSTPNYVKNEEVLYQHKLKGIHKDWSQWSAIPQVSYEGLPYGDYTFKIRSKIGDVLSVNEIEYKFTINTPWYSTKFAFILYFVLGIIMLYTLNKFYHAYYERQKEKTVLSIKNELALRESENKQQQMSFDNEKLSQDINNKNRELAISTMSLIKKNEFLNNIKKELIANDTSLGIKKVITLIDKNINNNDDWQFFQQAFDNADKDFLHKVKAKHPSLTPNDLKLCAYLRLNLSSKEIAPLLNISSRSVEVKRYRLRKKMNLAHEVSLTSYILEI